MIKSFILLVFLSLILLTDAKAQKDTIITTNNDTILCQILDKFDNIIVFRGTNDKNVNTISLSSIKYVSIDIEEKKKKEKKFNDFSVVNLGVGYGVNYGGLIGLQTILGYKNSGLLLGLGQLAGLTGYSIGGQISRHWFYANICYGTVAWHKYPGRSAMTDETSAVMMGAMMTPFQNKSLYLNIGIGHTLSAPINRFYTENFFVGALGISYRFGLGVDKLFK